MDKNNDSYKFIGTRNKIIYFIAIAISGPIFLLIRYMDQGKLGWLDYVGGIGGVMIGLLAVSIAIWYYNRK